MTGSSTCNFAGPELFETSSNSDRADDGYDVHDIELGRKTVQTDVYAFGCLCYAVSFLPIVQRA